jgi:hypothetical protein
MMRVRGARLPIRNIAEHLWRAKLVAGSLHAPATGER